jgi:hypothetical protein
MWIGRDVSQKIETALEELRRISVEDLDTQTGLYHPKS